MLLVSMLGTGKDVLAVLLMWRSGQLCGVGSASASTWTPGLNKVVWLLWQGLLPSELSWWPLDGIKIWENFRLNATQICLHLE